MSAVNIKGINRIFLVFPNGNHRLLHNIMKLTLIFGNFDILIYIIGPKQYKPLKFKVTKKKIQDTP